MAIDTTDAAATVVPDDDARLATTACTVLFAVAVALRLVPILLYPSLNWADEIFQAIEPAHRLVYGTGLVPWEFQLGARSWLLPGVIAGLMEIARLVGPGPDYYLPVIAIAFAALAAAPVACCFLWCRRLFGLPAAIAGATVVAVAPDLIYFGARTLTEVVAGNLLIVALFALEPGTDDIGRRRLLLGGLLLGLVFVLRVHLAPALALIVLWTGLRAPRARLPLIAAGIGIVLAADGGLDAVTLGYPFASIWRYLSYNVIYGVSSTFGVEPWSYYGVGEIGIWRGALPVLALLALLGARRKPILLAPALAIIVLHTAFAHKEYRFIYPALVLLTVLAGIGLAGAIDFIRRRPSPNGMRSGVDVWLAAIVGTGFWCALAFGVWIGPDMTALRNRAHDLLMASSFVAHEPDVCGIGLSIRATEGWIASGGYSYLHQRVPLYWPETPAELTAESGSFNALIINGEPPDDQGFKVLQCFGETCIARRSGGCTELAMQPMPYPTPIATLAPVPQPLWHR